MIGNRLEQVQKRTRRNVYIFNRHSTLGKVGSPGIILSRKENIDGVGDLMGLKCGGSPPKTVVIKRMAIKSFLCPQKIGHE